MKNISRQRLNYYGRVFVSIDVFKNGRLDDTSEGKSETALIKPNFDKMLKQAVKKALIKYMFNYGLIKRIKGEGYPDKLNNIVQKKKITYSIQDYYIIYAPQVKIKRINEKGKYKTKVNVDGKTRTEKYIYNKFDYDKESVYNDE